MVKIPTPKLYTCEKVGCGHQWLQRFKVFLDKDNKKIVRIDSSQDPKNCTLCKSPTWDIPRE
ncbi:hypothetical protein LCGC14_1054720 [marine sediment metagenome]|uniref:Uncharacterized protein n=1 Tax=marine sediment metagenome TaxID=412755 RepID=A0A0F9Q5V3_9ZZZZ